MRQQTEFVGFRAEASDKAAIKRLAEMLGGASQSAALRYAVRNAPQPGLAVQQPQQQLEREAQHG